MIELTTDDAQTRERILEHCRILEKMPPRFPRNLSARDRKKLRTDISLHELGDILSTFINVGLVAAKQTMMAPPKDCKYSGSGVSIVLGRKEVLLGPFVSYDWNNEVNHAGLDDDLIIVRTGEDVFATYNAELEDFRDMPRHFLEDGENEYF